MPLSTRTTKRPSLSVCTVDKLGNSASEVAFEAAATVARPGCTTRLRSGARVASTARPETCGRSPSVIGAAQPLDGPTDVVVTVAWNGALAAGETDTA